MANDDKPRPGDRAAPSDDARRLLDHEYRAVLGLLSEYVFRLSVKSDGTAAMTMAWFSTWSCPAWMARATLAAMRRIQPEVRVLLTSGFAQAAHAEAAARTGVCGFLHKPFSVDELGKRVEAALAVGCADHDS